ncbi:MAG: sigma-70 family RNA polymerase sigma factor, partial [Planctomycetes bacterium]|nr:sigma-70 family RNA polymerase sigma factor [Planctomycetota bacterium]
TGSSSLPDVADLAGDEPAASVQFDRAWAHRLMREAGDRMRARAEGGDATARLRVELLRLRFGEGLPVRDIADRWGFDADAVHRAYARARDEFKACLRQIVAEQAVRTESDLDAECRRVFEMLG